MNTKLILLIIIFIITTPLLMESVTSMSTPIGTVGTYPSRVSQKSICRTSNGVLYVVSSSLVGSPSGYQVLLAESRDNGSTWSSYKYQVTPNSTGKRNQTYPTICVDSNNVIYVSWYGELQGYNNVRIRFRKFYLSNLSFSVNIINITLLTTTTNVNVFTAVDSNDNLYMMWTDNNTIRLKTHWNSNNTFNRINLNVSTGTFTSPYYPNAVIDDSNTMRILFECNGLTFISYRKYYITNNSFSVKIINVTKIQSSVDFCFVMSKNGDMTLVWYSNELKATNNIRTKRYFYSNNTWCGKTINVTREPSNAQTTCTLGLEYSTSNIYYLFTGKSNLSAANQIRSSNYTFLNNTFGSVTNWTKGSLTHNVGSCLYAWYPNISGVHTNIPSFGLKGVFTNNTFLYYISSQSIENYVIETITADYNPKMTDSNPLSSTVFNIIGIFITISAIFILVVLIEKYRRR